MAGVDEPDVVIIVFYELCSHLDQLDVFTPLEVISHQQAIVVGKLSELFGLNQRREVFQMAAIVDPGVRAERVGDRGFEVDSD